jgi:hypothetical protein
VALWPQSPGPSCRTFFGQATEGSFPPPYGRGTIHLSEIGGNASTAAYTPFSFVLRTPACNYTFGPPKLNTYTTDSLVKLNLTQPAGGLAECPGDSDCGRGFWFAATLGGHFALLDTAGPGTVCPAYFARVNDGDASSGTFVAVEAAEGTQPAWVTEGYVGSYAGGQTLGFNVTLNAEPCGGVYTVDWASLSPGTAELGSYTLAAGAATAAFEATDPLTCWSECAAAGYNIAWDASGEPPPPAAAAAAAAVSMAGHAADVSPSSSITPHPRHPAPPPNHQTPLHNSSRNVPKEQLEAA